MNAARLELLPFVGPPALLPVWGAFARLSYAAAAALWRAVLVLSLAALLGIALRAAAVPLTGHNAIAGAVALLGFGAVTNAFSLGQIALPVAAAIGAAFAATRFGGKALATTIAFAQPNLALALAGEFRKKRAALAVICGVALFALLCAGINANAIFTYLQVLIAHGASEQFSAIQLTPAAAAYGLGASGSAALAIGLAVSLLATPVWVFAMIRFRDRTTLFVISSALLPFASAFFHQHDLVIEFIPAVILVLRAPLNALPAAVTGAIFCAVNWVGLAQYPHAIWQTVLLSGGFAVALLSMRDDVTSRAAGAAGMTVFMVAFGGVVARAHAMPVWPDAMTALPKLGNATAAGIWHAEQLATGLFVRDTMWALLRCVSLAGCAMLAFAAFSSRGLADSRTSAADPD